MTKDRYPGPYAILECELDIWFFQLDGEYGEWIFDIHCTLAEFLEVNNIEPEEIVCIIIKCEKEEGFMIGGGAVPLHYITPTLPTIH